MWFDVDPRSSTPIYQQLMEGIKEGIARGILAPGERLPTVRDLASELSLSPNTVAKAYQRLEQEKIIETMRSRGTFIAEQPPIVNSEEGWEEVGVLLDKVLVEAYHLGISHEDLRRLFARKLGNWNRRGEE